MHPINGVPRARAGLALRSGMLVVPLVVLGLGLLNGGCASSSRSSVLPWATPTPFLGLPGMITEFPVPRHGGITQLSAPVLGPDGNLWFLHVVGNGDSNVPHDPTTSRIGRITPEGALTEFP